MLTKDDLNSIEKLLDKKIIPLDKKINKVQKTLDHTINFFDNEVLDLKKRVKILEAHPNLKLHQL